MKTNNKSTNKLSNRLKIKKGISEDELLELSIWAKAIRQLNAPTPKELEKMKAKQEKNDRLAMIIGAVFCIGVILFVCIITLY